MRFIMAIAYVLLGLCALSSGAPMPPERPNPKFAVLQHIHPLQSITPKMLNELTDSFFTEHTVFQMVNGKLEGVALSDIEKERASANGKRRGVIDIVIYPRRKWQWRDQPSPTQAYQSGVPYAESILLLLVQHSGFFPGPDGTYTIHFTLNGFSKIWAAFPKSDGFNYLISLYDPSAGPSHEGPKEQFSGQVYPCSGECKDPSVQLYHSWAEVFGYEEALVYVGPVSKMPRKEDDGMGQCRQYLATAFALPNYFFVMPPPRPESHGDTI
ncbi:hypothetical protein EV361DRAFT_914321 [Lentinula raphanica]|nr:hypothetical protein EV361DRAFT_914321 [Lentinula raphanica]